MLQEYWASTVIFIGIFSQRNLLHFERKNKLVGADRKTS